MTTVPQKVEELVNQSPFYKRLIAQDLLNISQLARKFKPQVEEALFKDVSEASIVMALKRLSHRIRYESKINYAKHFGDISLKSGLTELTYKNSASLYVSIEKLLNKASQNESAYITFVKGAWQTTIIASTALVDTIREIFSKESLEVEFPNLSAVTIQLGNEHINEPGIIAYMLDMLAFEGVNVMEVVSTFDELTVIIRDEEVERAFGIMNRVKKF